MTLVRKLREFWSHAATLSSRAGDSMSDGVRNNAALNRFELDVDGQQAVSYYRMTPGVITFVHTEVPQALSGRGIGTKLIRGVLDWVRAQGLKVVPQCPFVSAFMGKHPEYNDLLH
jgi:uncharacterized protein